MSEGLHRIIYRRNGAQGLSSKNIIKLSTDSRSMVRIIPEKFKNLRQFGNFRDQTLFHIKDLHFIISFKKINLTLLYIFRIFQEDSELFRDFQRFKKNIIIAIATIAHITLVRSPAPTAVIPSLLKI